MSVSALDRISVLRRGPSSSVIRISGELLLAAGVFALVFIVHSRWIYTHFSSDGYLLDSGWLAYLFGSGDPLLHDPSGINQLSFYAHHLSPHIFLFGAPLSGLGLPGIEIFAYHQGLFFGLFFLAVYLLVVSARLPWRYELIATVVAIAVGTLSNALLQAAAYPHYEIAMTAVSSLAVATWVTGHRRLFAICLLWLPLIREDGGLYVGFVCLACIALDSGPRLQFDRRTRLLLTVAVAGLAATAGSFLVKTLFFPGFDAFASNYSGRSWDHVSAAFVVDRLRAMVVNPNITPVLVGCVVLAIFDVRYLIGVALLSPLYLLHVLSVRPEHGHFTLYFALPWLLPCLLWLAVFVRRAKFSAVSGAEAMILVISSLALAAPIQAAVGVKGEFWYVAKWALTRPVADLKGMQDFAIWVRGTFSEGSNEPGSTEKNCVSMGVAALIPNRVRPDEVLNGADDVPACRTVLLMRGDMQYGGLVARAESDRFTRVAVRDNIELWLTSTPSSARALQ
jgi:hypothetical protein